MGKKDVGKTTTTEGVKELIKMQDFDSRKTHESIKVMCVTGMATDF